MSKGTVIAIAVVATVLLLAFIAACIFFCLRRRSRKTGAKRNYDIGASDRNVDNPDFTSKTPLMRQEDQSQTDYRASPTPTYDEENDADLSAPPPLRHSFSGVSLRSLPPSYSAAIHKANEGENEPTGDNRHKRDSSIGGSDGLRPLMLVAAQKGQDLEQDISEQRSRDEQSSPDRSSLIPPRPAGRPRAGSRFREEDLDV